MEKTLSELIREYKDGGKRNFEKIAEKMNPLIEFYARKLYTWVRTGIRIGTDRNFLSSLIACFSTFGGSLFIKMSGNLLVISDVHSSMSASV